MLYGKVFLLRSNIDKTQHKENEIQQNDEDEGAKTKTKMR